MRKITKWFLTCALLCIAGVVSAGEETSIMVRDYTTTAEYPYWWMGDRVDNEANQPYFCNGTATVQIVDGALEIANTSDAGNNWDLQPFIIDWFNIQEGYGYKIKITMKADNAGTANLSMGTWDGAENIGLTFEASSDFVEYTAVCAKASANAVASENNGHVLWQGRKFVGTVWIQKVEVIEVAPDEPIKEPVWTNIILNSDLTNDDMRCFYSKEYPATDPVLSTVADGAIVVKSAAKISQDYDTQFWIRVPQVVPAGTKFKISFDYKASAAASVGTQAHNEPGDYVHWACIPSVNFTTDWQTYNETVTVPSQCDGSDHEGKYLNNFHSIAFNLSKDAPIDYYFKNIKFEIDQEAITEFDFPKPKPLFADGTYYIYNTKAQKFLGAGAAWGTHAVVNETGLDYTIAFTEDGKYTLDSQVSNGGVQNYVNGYADDGPWNDGNAFGWTFAKAENDSYTISNGAKFLTAGDDGVVTFTDDAAAADQWTLIAAGDRVNELLATLENASENSGVDASFLITAANFNRNDMRNASWVATKSGGNQTIGGPNGNRATYGCESWNNTFDIYQVCDLAPDGIYEFTLDGYGTNGTTLIYLNNTEVPFVNTESAANFGEALDRIAAGEFTGNTTGKVKVMGALKIGVKRNEQVGADWTVFDNARLTYYGPVPADDYLKIYEEALAAAEEAYWDEAYDAVEGSERDALKRLMEMEVDLESANELALAIQALVDATNKFKEAKGAYDALAAAKESLAELDFPYASAEKEEAAIAALETPAASAIDAELATTALYTAYRQYAESSAMLESDAEAEDMTQTITNPNAESEIAEPWIVVLGENSGGSLGIRDNEPLTDGFGNSQYKYFDGGNWGAQAWDVSMNQEIMLPKGTYQLTVASRAAADMTNFILNVNDGVYQNVKDMLHIGASNGLFGRGWNDTSIEFTVAEDNTPVVIGVQGIADVQYQWMSFTRFRLYKFSERFVTGIANVKTEKANDVIYDLQGRRVVAPVKGLYIVNGKKIVK